MEKLRKTGRKPAPAPETANNNPAGRKVFGGNKLELSENVASKLVGGIVEKGVSDNFLSPPSSAPRLSVLPFPVARHRSHGPHWAPNQSANTTNGVDDENDEEDNDPTNYDPLADFADPIVKKKKKTLDLSNWRELVPSSRVLKEKKSFDLTMGVEDQNTNREAMRISDAEGTSMPVNSNNDSPSGSNHAAFVDAITQSISSANKELNRSSDLPSKENDDEALRSLGDQCGNIQGDLNSLTGKTIRSNAMDEALLQRQPYADVDMGVGQHLALDNSRVRGKDPSALFGQSSVGYVQGNVSLESQIDNENRALLDRMSVEEIAKAQEDIQNRINPALVNILKKRGIQKLEKQINSRCVSGAQDIQAAGDKLYDKHIMEGQNESSGLKSVIAPPEITPSLQNAEKMPDEGVVRSSISNGGSSWNNWSKRVEAVRNLRFSLDGNVIEESSSGTTYSADNVAERDFLRTEGDPGAAGYTVKEALELTRSVVPGQRALALHLLVSVLSKALHNIFNGQLGCTTTSSNGHSQLDCMTSASCDKLADWEAVWTYALGPEPELILSLRMALDDNHNSVVLASAKVIQCILSCDVNEKFFNRLQKMALKSLCTGPVLRSRPDIKHGFLGGGFWKYSTKPSNIFPLDMEIVNNQSGAEPTIQDDNVVAGQDIVSGLVRMGILPRLRYLLETDPTLAIEDCTLSILIGIARHSPTCANAIWKCERLIQTIVARFSAKDSSEQHGSKIKSVILLRVLAQSSKSICTEFINEGFFETLTWQLYCVTSSIEEWVKSGREACKLFSEMMIEQLRLWRVCIMYGCCVSYFSGFFPTLCLWLNAPTFENLMRKDLFPEFACISSESYLVLATLATKLSDPYSSENLDGIDFWHWSNVSPMVDMALKWIDVVTDATTSKFLYQENGVESKLKCLNSCQSSLLWILSSVLHMLHVLLMKVTPDDSLQLSGFCNNGKKLPELVAKISEHVIRKNFLNFSDITESECCGMSSFIERLFYFRHQSDPELSVASIWCLHGLFRVITSIDPLIQLIKDKPRQICLQGFELSEESKILDDGILKWTFPQWRKVVSELMKLVTSEWHLLLDIEVFGRGGPSPGVGAGWGAPGGGFWSSNVTLVRADVTLLIELLEIFHSSPAMDFPGIEEDTFITQCINFTLASSLVAGPGDKMIVQKVIDMLVQIRVLKYLNRCILHFPHCNRQRNRFKWEYTEADIMQFSKLLASHFTSRWLSVKKKKIKAKDPKCSEGSVAKKVGNSLDTIPEDVEMSGLASENINALTVEWAHQRLPLPRHWLLSPISTIDDITSSDTPNVSAGVPPPQTPSESVEVVKAGLFFLLGIEAISLKLPDDDISVIRSIPLIWKLHSLSVALLLGMGVTEEERSRDVFEALQCLYSQHLDELSFSSKCNSSLLRFQSEIHDSYPIFIETLVEQFAAVSYGDLIFGRQIAIYLHHQVEASVRLASWNALSNAHVLELLPPLGDCLSQAEGYLEPVEEDGRILEAYGKSWVSGSLDKAVTLGSMTFTIVLHHLSSFIFSKHQGEKLVLRNKLVKSLLRDYSRKQLHVGMMLDLIKYNYSSSVEMTQLGTDRIYQRFEQLREACEGNSQLLSVVEKLRFSFSMH